MASCEEGVPPGNAAMLTQLPQHIHMPPFVSFIVPLLLFLPPPLFLHGAAAGKKGKETDLGKS